MSVTPLILLNALVFFLWYALPVEFMMNNFTVSAAGLLQGRVWTLVTSMFSHNMIWHILLNMIVLRDFGGALARMLGDRSFLKFYFVAGIVSSLGHVLVSIFIMGEPNLPALGASGAISGLILVFALLFPRERIAFFGLIPVPALVGALLFIGLDVWGIIAQAGGGGLPIGHGAHLGGALTGIVYYFVSLRPRLRISRHA